MKFALFLAVIFAFIVTVGAVALKAHAAPAAIAYDMVDSTSQNLISYADDPAIPFSSIGDGFPAQCFAIDSFCRPR